MVLNPSHFEGELTIAQRGEYAPSSFAFTSELDWYVRKYEPIFYRAVIGEKLYQKMIDGMTPDDDEPNVWNKLAKRTALLAAAFVWYNYMLDINTQTTGSGEVMPEFISGTRKSSQEKWIRIKNKLVESLGHFAEWIYYELHIYTDFNPDKDLFKELFLDDKDKLIIENLYGI